MFDTGLDILVMPPPIAFAVNAAFSPPATYDNETGSFLVSCDATPPDFAIQINGTIFPMEKEEMIVKVGGKGVGGEKCMSVVGNGGTAAPYMLGVAFMRGVVVVHDIGRNELRVARRKFGKGENGHGGAEGGCEED